MKSSLSVVRIHVAESLPTRERGLKFEHSDNNHVIALSLPTRERGLKSIYAFAETTSEVVAPHAGAWIEIVLPSAVMPEMVSLPTRERGLKFDKYEEIESGKKGRSPRGSVD